MSNMNDKRILDLKKQIEDKKKNIKSLRFAPITNCSIELDGNRHNIQVLNRDDLIHLIVKLNSYMLSAEDLDMSDEYIVSGYKAEDWIVDIKSRLEIIVNKEEERKLKVMEDKLIKLLSEGKKVELEIDEIESLLKE